MVQRNGNKPTTSSKQDITMKHFNCFNNLFLSILYLFNSNSLSFWGNKGEKLPPWYSLSNPHTFCSSCHNSKSAAGLQMGPSCPRPCPATYSTFPGRCFCLVWKKRLSKKMKEVHHLYSPSFISYWLMAWWLSIILVSKEISISWPWTLISI